MWHEQNRHDHLLNIYGDLRTICNEYGHMWLALSVCCCDRTFVRTGQMFAVEAEQMSVAGIGQMFWYVVEAGQMSLAEAAQTFAAQTEQNVCS